MSGSPFGIGETIGTFASIGAQKDASEKANAIQMYALQQQKKMYDEQMARQEPFYQQGITSLADYAKMLKGGYDMKESPAAQYELQQGTKTMNRQLAGRGMLGGGTAANRLTELSAGIGARDWQNQYSRLVDSLKLGTGSAASMGQSGQVYGNQVGQGASGISNTAMNLGNNLTSLYANYANTMGKNMGRNVGGALGQVNWGSGGNDYNPETPPTDPSYFGN